MGTLGTRCWAFVAGWTRNTCKNKMIQLKIHDVGDEQLDCSTHPCFDDLKGAQGFVDDTFE